MSNKPFIEVAFFDLGDTLIVGHREWVPGAQVTLARLKEKGIRLGIISNTGELARPDILKLLPADFDLSLFDKQLLVFSSEVHVAKPNQEIFRLAIKRANVSPGKCLFCTEEPSHITVAKKEKMKTFVVRKPPNSDIGELVDKLVATGVLPA